MVDWGARTSYFVLSQPFGCHLVLLCILFILLQAAAPPPSSARRDPVEVRDLVPPNDPLATHDLSFDASFARQAVEYLRSNNAKLAERMVGSPAITHILNHARNFDYDVPKESRQALLESLLGAKNEKQEAVRSAVCEQSIEYFSKTMLADQHWVADALRYLPADFRFHGTLFLTFGYDIGVAFGPNASLNCTHSHFNNHSRELLYYAIHELHHVGFMAYQTPPKLSDIKTCEDLVNLVEYSTEMEGMGVLAAYQRRRDDHALADDPDYIALQDQNRMQSDLASYFKDYQYLKNRRTQLADADAWAVITRMSSGERLWYRVGTSMAQRIEARKGRTALIELVKQGPRQFITTYETLFPPHVAP
jgi:Putative zinc dependent peptidase (DUF5700)